MGRKTRDPCNHLRRCFHGNVCTRISLSSAICSFCVRDRFLPLSIQQTISRRFWWKTWNHSLYFDALSFCFEKTMVNFLIILLVSQIATQLTHNYGTVRASAGFTLAFIGLTFAFPFAIVPTLHAVFLGSSFVGMTDPKRLSRVQLMIASFIFCLIFTFILGHLQGFGGTLGVSAFSACGITYFTWGFLKKFKRVDELGS